MNSDTKFATSTTTTEERLEQIHRRIDRLQAFAQMDDAARSRFEGHLEALRREEASAAAALRSAPESSEQQLGQLRTRLAVAEHALIADVADEWPAFTVAVEDELRSWDVYLERLQATAAEEATTGREQAEGAIADLRAQRLAVAASLAQAEEQVENAWREQRDRLGAARDELGKKADELSANGKERSTR